MQFELTPFLEELASRLQSAAAVVPFSQLSVVAWAMFAFSGALGANSSFNTDERSPGSVSKVSFH